MKKSSKKLKRKLHAYRDIALTGGVVATVSLSLASRLHGEAVSYWVNDHIPPSTTDQGYDIDGDGDDDVYFHTYSSSVVMEAERDAMGGGCQTLCFSNILIEGNLVQGLEKGQLVYVHNKSFNISANLHSGDSGPFYNQPSPRYAGFNFVRAGADSTVNAWVELVVTGSVAEGLGLNVIAFGYETEPIIGIEAGYPALPVATKNTSWGAIKSLFKK
ncbi:MAG: hypothetical protein ACYSWP_21280 [Planctomycetota bacterium]|jgi:hypothetical protein